jgi:uncharacterized protein
MKHVLRHQRHFWLFLVFSSLLLVLPSIAYAQQGDVYTITVTGTGTATAAAEAITLEIGVERVGSDLTTTRQSINTTINTVINALGAYDVQPTDFALIEISVNPEDLRDLNGSPSGEFVYRLQSVYLVTIRNVDQIQAIIDEVIFKGANIVRNIRFVMQSSSALEEQARVLALASAQARATTLGKQLQLVLDVPLVINESDVTWHGISDPRSDSNNLVPALASNAITVTVEVRVTYSYRVGG